MKKFEEELDKKVGTFDVVGHHNGVCCLVEKVKALGKDWVSPEDHILEIKENQRLRKENQRLRGIIGDMSSKIGKLKYQLEKQQPEIPEFVAEWIKSQDHNTINRNGTLVYEHYKKEPENDDYYPVHDWIADHFDEFLQALIYGYTVKQKRFYLKHKSVLIFDPDSDDSDVDELYLASDGNFVPYQHLAKIFTQQEIDSMETGSYEQIEVEE